MKYKIIVRLRGDHSGCAV